MPPLMVLATIGEYHLDLIIRYGAVPIIVPRISGIHNVLESFEPIHGVLLCEGEDLDPTLYISSSELSHDELEEVRSLHPSDTAIDRKKDSIELSLARLCLGRNIPFLGVCRGSQVLNVTCGATLYQDVERELLREGRQDMVARIDYNNYDGHRHKVRIVENTPLHRWFGEEENMVNSYHHQGVKRSGERLVPMAFAPDGLVEGFYDPKVYEPDEGRFIMGLQFHPERMRRPDSDDFDYPGCPLAYQEFVKAVRAYQNRANAWTNPQSSPKLDQEAEKRRKIVNRSFCVAKEFLEPSTGLSLQQEKRLKLLGMTVRNGSNYMTKIEERGVAAAATRNVMEKMSIEQLLELLSFYHEMGQICTDMLERELADSLNA